MDVERFDSQGHALKRQRFRDAHALTLAAGEKTVASRERFVRALSGMVFVVTWALSYPVAWASPSPEHVDRVSDWTIDDHDPERSVPTEAARERSPLEMGYWLMDLAAKAQAAAQHGDHSAAIRYYRAMAIAVPDRAVAPRQLCKEYEAIHDASSAIASCALALSLAGASVDDAFEYAKLMLGMPDPFTDSDRASLSAFIERIRTTLRNDSFAAPLECALAVRTRNASELRECVPALMAQAPNDPLTLASQGTLAIETKNDTLARQVLEKVRPLSLSPDLMGRVEEQLAAPRLLGASPWLLTYVLFVSPVMVLGVVGVYWQQRRRRTE